MAEPIPMLLDDNRVPVFYAGGDQINDFRGLAEPVPGPEDWVGSLVTLPSAILPPDADPTSGLSRVADGTTLLDLVAADPHGWLGADLARAYGGSSALLVKLLDAGERLPVHCHPTRDFARRNLDSVFGKTEGWIVMRAQPDAALWVGMHQDVSTTDMRRWIDAQDADSMLKAMIRIPAKPGMVVYVPAGVPHSIGPGVMITELQEPTSFSILAEHEPFGVPSQAAALGVGWDLAMSCFDLGSFETRMQALLPQQTVIARTSGGEVVSLFDREADEFFRAWRITSSDSVTLPEPSFAVLVVVAGAGHLSWFGGTFPVRAGQTVVVPYTVGPLTFSGSLDVIACLPPAV